MFQGADILVAGSARPLLAVSVGGEVCRLGREGRPGCAGPDSVSGAFARGERIESVMYGIFEDAEVLFVDGAQVPVAHKFGDRMVVLRGTGGPDEASLYYTADEWQAFILGVKEGEFDDMAAGPADPEGGERVVALRDSKDPDGPKLIFSADGWKDLLVAIKAAEHELPSDMRELLDERFK